MSAADYIPRQSIFGELLNYRQQQVAEEERKRQIAQDQAGAQFLTQVLGKYLNGAQVPNMAAGQAFAQTQPQLAQGQRISQQTGFEAEDRPREIAQQELRNQQVQTSIDAAQQNIDYLKQANPYRLMNEMVQPDLTKANIGRVNADTSLTGAQTQQMLTLMPEQFRKLQLENDAYPEQQKSDLAYKQALTNAAIQSTDASKLKTPAEIKLMQDQGKYYEDRGNPLGGFQKPEQTPKQKALSEGLMKAVNKINGVPDKVPPTTNTPSDSMAPTPIRGQSSIPAQALTGEGLQVGYSAPTPGVDPTKSINDLTQIHNQIMQSLKNAKSGAEADMLRKQMFDVEQALKQYGIDLSVPAHPSLLSPELLNQIKTRSM